MDILSPLHIITLFVVVVVGERLTVSPSPLATFSSRMQERLRLSPSSAHALPTTRFLKATKRDCFSRVSLTLEITLIILLSYNIKQ